VIPPHFINAEDLRGTDIAALDARGTFADMVVLADGSQWCCYCRYRYEPFNRGTGLAVRLWVRTR
jgi:hypothetical protein